MRRVNQVVLICTAFAMPTGVWAQASSETEDCAASFYVLKQVAGSGIGVCQSTVAPERASLSYTFDHQASTSEGTADVAFAYRLGRVAIAGENAVSRFVFSEFEGDIGADDAENQIRTGIYAEGFAISSAMPDNYDLSLLWGVSGYYLTDFDMEASGYGMSVSVSPVINSDVLGVNYRGTKYHTPYVIARAKLDRFWVDRGGNTGFGDDTDHATLAATIGVGYAASADKLFAFDAQVTHTQKWDLINGGNLGATNARLSVPLGSSDKVALSVVYNRIEGDALDDLEETTKLTLDFAF